MKKLIVITLLLIAVQVQGQSLLYPKQTDTVEELKTGSLLYRKTPNERVISVEPVLRIPPQDTVHKFVDYGKPTQIHYIGIINGKDTVWKEVGKGSSQGFKEQTDTVEVQQELLNVQKVYKETYEQKVKQLETTDADLIRLQGIILYLNEKLKALKK